MLLRVIHGDDCVAKFVGTYRDRVAGELVAGLRSCSLDSSESLVVLKWIERRGNFWEPDERYARLTSQSATQGGDLLLQPVSRRELVDPSKAPSLGEILARLNGVRRLVVKRTDGTLTPLVAMSLPRVEGDHPGAFTWARFWPASAGPFEEVATSE